MIWAQVTQSYFALPSCRKVIHAFLVTVYFITQFILLHFYHAFYPRGRFGLALNAYKIHKKMKKEFNINARILAGALIMLVFLALNNKII